MILQNNVNMFETYVYIQNSEERIGQRKFRNFSIQERKLKRKGCLVGAHNVERQKLRILRGQMVESREKG